MAELFENMQLAALQNEVDRVVFWALRRTCRVTQEQKLDVRAYVREAALKLCPSDMTRRVVECCMNHTHYTNVQDAHMVGSRAQTGCAVLRQITQAPRRVRPGLCGSIALSDLNESELEARDHVSCL